MVRAALVVSIVTSPTRARLRTAVRACASLTDAPPAYWLRNAQAAWLVSTVPGMPLGSSRQVSASAGQARPTGGSRSARSIDRAPAPATVDEMIPAAAL